MQWTIRLSPFELSEEITLMVGPCFNNPLAEGQSPTLQLGPPNARRFNPLECITI